MLKCIENHSKPNYNTVIVLDVYSGTSYIKTIKTAFIVYESDWFRLFSKLPKPFLMCHDVLYPAVYQNPFHIASVL